MSEPIHTTTLANGVRVVCVPAPAVASASVAVFVQSGSAHESRALNGISHFVEHMVFKGSARRDARRINLDAERLGAEVNAHTDKDHTAFTVHGMAQHAEELLAMLGEIVFEPVFPAAEVERERQVLLHECTEDEDDPLSTAFKLFDKACWGVHAVAQSVIGPRANIERFRRDDLAGYVARQYGGANVVVGAAGTIDPDRIARRAEAVFGGLPRGTPNAVAPAAYRGGIASRRIDGSSQAHLVLGGAVPTLADDDAAASVAAAVFGDGMSSPLMDRVREQRGLAYYAACSADLLQPCGQFVVEASTAPRDLQPLLAEVMQLLVRHADRVDAVDLERAHNQLAVRTLRAHERPYRRLEDAVLDLYALGRVRAGGEWLERLRAVDAAGVRDAFARLLDGGLSVALAGALPRAAGDLVRQQVAAAGMRPAPARA